MERYTPLSENKNIKLYIGNNNNTTPKQVYRFRKISVISFCTKKTKHRFLPSYQRKENNDIEQRKAPQPTKNTTERVKTRHRARKRVKSTYHSPSHTFFSFSRNFFFSLSLLSSVGHLSTTQNKKNKLPFFLI
jgi:hypothetical protein